MAILTTATNSYLDWFRYASVCGLLLTLAWSAQAANTIDPATIGATDVVLDPFDQQTPLANPLADPLNLGSEDLAVGNTVSGVLLIDGGSTVANRLGYLGYQPGSFGLVGVRDAGSTWENTNRIFVGYDGEGLLSVMAGGSVTSNGGDIASRASSVGTATVTGPGSTWSSSGSIQVGGSGNGTLNVTGGASVTNASSNIGNMPDSVGDVTVDGNGSTWTNNSELNVGFAGTGSLQVSGGGTVSSASAYISRFADSIGSATVDGTGSTWNSAAGLTIGPQGNLTISSGGAVTAADRTRLNFDDTHAASIFFDEGSLTTGSLYAFPRDLPGNGIINTKGLVSDVDLTFDASNGLSKTLNFNELPGQNVTVQLDIDGTGDIGVGYRGTATMHVADGFVLPSVQGHIGSGAGSIGAATVEGNGTRWENSSFLFVGSGGKGSTTVSGGAGLTSAGSFVGFLPDSEGEVTIDGTGSNWNDSETISVGSSGTGTLNISAGGSVNSLGAIVGDEDRSIGNVSIHGAGSNWTTTVGITNIGRTGDASLSITGGGSFNTHDAFVSRFSRSESIVHIEGTGSTWTNTGFLNIAGRGQATVRIAEGGTLNTNIVSLGRVAGAAKGTVIVEGPGSTFNAAADIFVAHEADGTLNVLAGGQVNSTTGRIANGGLPSPTGVANVDGIGSTWTNTTNLVVGNNGEGFLNITGGGLVSVGGTLTIGSSFIGDPESFVSLATGGMLAVAGDIDDSITQFLDNIPHIASRDVLRYWDETHEIWSPITDAVLGDDYTLQFLTSGDLAGHTLLTVGELPNTPGDYNDDGIVNTADYTLWRDNLGANLAFPNETATPGEVTQEDYVVWRSNFGSGASFALTTSPSIVPEPSSMLLLLMALSLTCRRSSFQSTTAAAS